MRKTEKIWYAVVTNNDSDWGYGSYNRRTALKMARESARTGLYHRVDLVWISEGHRPGTDPIAIQEVTVYRNDGET